MYAKHEKARKVVRAVVGVTSSLYAPNPATAPNQHDAQPTRDQQAYSVPASPQAVRASQGPEFRQAPGTRAPVVRAASPRPPAGERLATGVAGGLGVKGASEETPQGKRNEQDKQVLDGLEVDRRRAEEPKAPIQSPKNKKGRDEGPGRGRPRGPAHGRGAQRGAGPSDEPSGKGKEGRGARRPGAKESQNKGRDAGRRENEGRPGQQQPKQSGTQRNYAQGSNGQQPKQSGTQRNYAQGSNGQQPKQDGTQRNYAQGSNGQQPKQDGTQRNYAQGPNGQQPKQNGTRKDGASADNHAEAPKQPPKPPPKPPGK
ncbi:hypothetical protein [Actinomycetospora corticicola]|uniref:hypothetical protein n=1 Tax=Actinomycetospora corticicola TaxID=663602 RepID=UPI0015CB1ECD